MLDNFLNKSKPINFVGILVLFFLGLFSVLFMEVFKGDFSFSKIMESISIIVLFLFTFFLMNFIVVKNDLTFDNSYGFFFIICLFVLILPDVISIKTLFLNIIYLLGLRKVYSLHSQKDIFEKIFDAGFWLGVFFILDSLSMPFFLLIFISIYIHKKNTINSAIIALIAFIVPLFIYFSYYFWIDNTAVFYDLFNVKPSLYFNANSNKLLFYPVIGIATFVMASMFLKSRKAFSVNNKFKKEWILLIINLLIAVFFILIHNTKTYSNYIFAIFPAAIILANGLEMIEKKIFKNILIYLFLIGSFLIRYLL